MPRAPSIQLTVAIAFKALLGMSNPRNRDRGIQLDVTQAGMRNGFQSSAVICINVCFQLSPGAGVQVSRGRPGLPELVGWPQRGFSCLALLLPPPGRVSCQGMKWAASSLFAKKGGS